MQLGVHEAAAEIEAALAAEDFEEAAAVQQDCEAAQAQVAALCQEHGLQVRRSQCPQNHQRRWSALGRTALLSV